MHRSFVGLSVGVLFSVLMLVGACGPRASETAETPPATNSMIEAPVVAPTNAVAEVLTASRTTAPAAGAMVLAIKDASGADLSGDPVKGAAVYRQCQSCHMKEAGMNKVGPSLAGIAGRTAGTVPGFRYSGANKNSGITWTDQELYSYFENPRAKIPGTTMAFVGIKDSQKRADLIAYLKSPT